MYARFFGLSENPFGLPPDPRYLYLSRRHQEALAHLTYGVTQGGGFVLLSGEVGTGKTLLIRALLERLPQNVDVALVLYPMLSVREFVASICDDLRVPYPRDTDSLKVLIDALNAYLLDNHGRGRRTVLIIDEAHKLSHEVLEQVRLLTNLETTKEKLLQILLVGQPELTALLAQPHLRQLAQRVTARYELGHLPAAETREYVQHRLHVAGAHTAIFTQGGLRALHRLSGGVPRLINVTADRALLGAYAHGRLKVGAGPVARAALEVGRLGAPRRFWQRAPVLALAASLVAVLAFWQWQHVAANRATAHPARETAAAPPVTATAALADVLADPVLRSDTDSAFAAMFSRWRLDYAHLPGAGGCERATAAGLRCLAGAGSWTNLRSHDRPAIIELTDGQARRHHVLVSSIGNDHATLVFGNRTQRFPLAEIERHWYGKYLLVWRAPFADPGPVRLGMQGPAVDWLREQLAAASAAGPFDAALEQSVREFQRRQGLPDDGVVGQLTWLQLSLLDSRPGREATPRLRDSGAP